MHPSPFLPRLHLFVCSNRRPAESPLGPGCGRAGDAVFDALKAEVAARRCFGEVWVTRTECIGLCPREGATMAAYAARSTDGNGVVFTEVVPDDARALLERELSAMAAGGHAP
jgi:predicted metal-binding protein